MSPCHFGENTTICTRVCLLSVDNYGATELAMDAVSNAKIWHRWLGYLNKQSLELIKRNDCSGFNFDCTIVYCDVCAAWKNHQLDYSKENPARRHHWPFLALLR